MALSLTKFAGCSVTSVQANAGFQEQISNLRLGLVEDLAAGDSYIYPEPGTPMSFTFGGMRFDGLVQHRGKDRSTSGDPTFSVLLYSPTEVLENIQLIMDAYRGPNVLCPNLLNVFGYLEGAGDNFGGSGKNASGIPWYRIKEAIGAIQWGTTDFSPGIWLKGHQYVVDVLSIPANQPDFYRVGGGAFMNMNDLIRTVFQDSGYDYIVCLEIAEGTGPHRIYFKSQSRLTQPPLGQIEELINSSTDLVSGSSTLEFRNDVTCGVILGGDVEAAYPMTETGTGEVIHPFWGFQFSNVLIPFGTTGNPPLVESDINGNLTEIGFNAIPIADIIGSTTYVCNIYELRFAMHSFESWTCFILRKRPEFAQTLGLGDVFPSVYGNAAYDSNPQSLYTASPEGVRLFTQHYKESPAIHLIERIYDFVRRTGEEYLGKQFMVRIPFQLKYAFEEETTNINFNNTVVSEGYWPDYQGGLNSGPLGLSYENFNRFMNDNGKFKTFVKFTGDLSFANLADLNPSTTLIQNNEVFMECTVEPTIYFSPAPSVKITLAEPIWSITPTLRDVVDIAWLLDIEDPTIVLNMIQSSNGNFELGIHPGAFGPTGAVICLKSNEYTYGPWVKLGAAGKVAISQDSELVPWNYGGFELMNQAAVAQLAEIATSRQVEEGGEKVIPGQPGLSLGDALDSLGPMVTSIDVTADANNGVQTTYRMRSQTPVAGSFSKHNADRLRRLGTAAQDTRRTIRAVMDRIRDNSRLINSATRQLNQRVANTIAQRNTNTVLQALAVFDINTGKVKVNTATKGLGASLVGQNIDDPDKFNNTSTVGMEGVFRPISTDVNSRGALAHYETPETGTVINNTNLNPFKAGTDTQWVANGDPETNKGNYTGRGDLDHTKMRPLVLRAPLTITGWGYDIQGNPVPNSYYDDHVAAEEQAYRDAAESGEEVQLPDEPVVKLQDMEGEFLQDYLQKSHKWKAGNVDLRWNPFNKTWISPGTVMMGTYVGAVSGLTGNYVQLEGFSDQYLKIADPDYLGDASTILNKKVACSYYTLKGVWYIISAQC